MEARAVRVKRSLTELQNGTLAFGPPKTAAGRRTVGFPELIAPVLRWHLSCFAQAEDDAMVFTGSAGALLRRGVDPPDRIALLRLAHQRVLLHASTLAQHRTAVDQGKCPDPAPWPEFYRAHDAEFVGRDEGRARTDLRSPSCHQKPQLDQLICAR